MTMITDTNTVKHAATEKPALNAEYALTSLNAAEYVPTAAQTAIMY